MARQRARFAQLLVRNGIVTGLACNPFALTPTESRREFLRGREPVDGSRRYPTLSARQNLGRHRQKAVNSSGLSALNRKSAPRAGYVQSTNLLTATRKIARKLGKCDDRAVNPCVSGSKPDQAPERVSSSKQVCCNDGHRGNLHGH